MQAGERYRAVDVYLCVCGVVFLGFEIAGGPEIRGSGSDGPSNGWLTGRVQGCEVVQSCQRGQVEAVLYGF